MIDRETVIEYFNFWKSLRQRDECRCEHHGPRNKEVCPREYAWRKYVDARDKYLSSLAKTSRGTDIFNTFEGMS